MMRSNRVMCFPAGTMVTVKDLPFVLSYDVAVMGSPENFGAAMCELAKAEQMQDQAMDGLKGDPSRVRQPNAETVAALEEARGMIKGKPHVYSDGKLAVFDENHDSLKQGHFYLINDSAGNSLSHIAFQNGPVPEHGVNGLTNEALLAILIHRTQILNEQFQCEENEDAIHFMMKAADQFEKRTKRRQAAGIEGKMVEQT
jgi:hypothetical protein